MTPADPICAISSAVGPAARMIVRLSGPAAHSLAASICPHLPAAASAHRHALHFANLTLCAWVYLFRAPRSYTGEDLVEFHLPGNPLLVRLLIQHLQTQGARLAEPGEFTARAYFNGRLDLTEAEGVAAVISAHGEQELQAARQLLAGELARRLRPLMDDLTQSLALLEAEIDFADEPVTFLPRPELRRRLDQLIENLHNLLSNSRRFERLSHEPRIVLVGRPNAGKSTLLNWLAGRDRAIVSPQAGTTRDVLWAEITLPSGAARLIDVAGLESEMKCENPPSGMPLTPSPGVPGEGKNPTSPEKISASKIKIPISVAVQMQQHARQAIAQADLALLIHDSTDPLPPLPLDRPIDLHVYTKADLLAESPDLPAGALLTSAKTGQGKDHLIKTLNHLAFTRPAGEAHLALNHRHVQSIEQAIENLHQAAATAESASIELLALELRTALDHLGQILGIVSPDDLLGEIFSRFCIGK